MVQTADFTSDESCRLLAQLLDSAPKLNECEIQYYSGARKIKIEYKADETEKDGDSGLIKILDKTTEEVIVEMTTSKATQININQDR